MNYKRQHIHSLPKGDVHSHFNLSASASPLKEKYPEFNISAPQNYNGFDGLMSLIEKNVNPTLTSSKVVIDLTGIGIQSSLADNVSFLEASVDIHLYKHFNHSIEEFIKALDQLKIKYQDQIDLRPEVGINRQSPEESIHKITIQCKDSKVFNCIDIYGSENEKDLHPFQEVYSTPNEMKMHRPF